MGTHSRYPHPPCICAAFRAAGFFRTILLSHQAVKTYLPVFSHIFKNDDEETEIKVLNAISRMSFKGRHISRRISRHV